MIDESKRHEATVNALHESIASIVRVRDNVTAIGRSRELSLAVTKLDEAAMLLVRATSNAWEIER